MEYYSYWGEDRFPYIFFFNTEPIHLEWIQMLDHFNYQSNFDPRGKFYPVADSRLSDYGGAQGYVRFVRKEFGS